MAPHEVLSVGSERQPVTARPLGWVRRHRWWVLGAAVLLLALVTADQWQRHREMDALLAQVTSGEQSIDAANGSLQVLVDYYTPVLSRPGGGGVRPAFTTDVSEAAAQGAASTEEAASSVAAVRILPWHRALVKAQDEYRARVLGWAAYLSALQENPEVIFGGAEDKLPSTNHAKEALSAAVPWLDSAARARIEELLAP